ncbi:LCP family protein [Streptomyces sp. NPDC054796]
MPAPARRTPSPDRTSPSSPAPDDARSDDARSGDPGGEDSARPRRRKRFRWGLTAAAGVSTLVLAASGAGHVLLSGLDSGVRRVDPFHGLGDRPNTTSGVNFLVVGTDGRDKLSAAEKRKYQLGGSACDCTDTLLMVHLSADRQRASVVSLPRDSYARLPAHTDSGTGERHEEQPAKLNSAYAHGGPRLTVRTVEAMTGIHMDHYLEVDFSSFMKTVDVLGGVPICTDKPLKDDHSGLDLPAGTSRLNGGQALQYVRARHLDAAADLGRMQRQQRFLASVISRATHSGVLMNPVKFDRVARTILGSMRADPGFGIDEMMALGQAMKGFTPASSEFAQVPIANANRIVPGLGSTVQWDAEKAGKLFRSLREDRPLSPEAKKREAKKAEKDGKAPAGGPESSTTTVDVAPNSIRVQVENGTDRQGLALRTDQALRATGFATTGGARNAASDDVEHTTIAYDPRWDRSARSLAKALPGAKLREEKGRGPVMGVVLGADHDKVRKVTGGAPAGSPGSGTDGGAVTGDRVACK